MRQACLMPTSRTTFLWQCVKQFMEVDMITKQKSAQPQELVLRYAKETTALEQYWHLAERPNLRKPPKNYKYVEELAHLQFELIRADSGHVEA